MEPEKIKVLYNTSLDLCSSFRDVRLMRPEKRTCWPPARFGRQNEKPPVIIGMAAGGSAEELFLADKANGVVRAFDVRSGQLEARDAYRLSDTAEPGRFCYCRRVQRSPRDTLHLHVGKSLDIHRSLVRAHNRRYLEFLVEGMPPPRRGSGIRES